MSFQGSHVRHFTTAKPWAWKVKYLYLTLTNPSIMRRRWQSSVTWVISLTGQETSSKPWPARVTARGTAPCPTVLVRTVCPTACWCYGVASTTSHLNTDLAVALYIYIGYIILYIIIYYYILYILGYWRYRNFIYIYIYIKCPTAQQSSKMV